MVILPEADISPDVAVKLVAVIDDDAVIEPVVVIVVAVIEPALFTTKPMAAPPSLICNA